MASVTYTPEQRAELVRIEADVSVHLKYQPCRLEHTLGVADTAVDLACAYGVDPFLARAAGLLHDWCKDRHDPSLVPVARAMGVDMGVELELVTPLLHSIIAERILPYIYPELPEEVFRAIGRHTLGAKDMSPLDMVLFVADGIEPNRPDAPAIQKVRAMVGVEPLEEVFFHNFAAGVAYVIETERYLYPGTLDIYNELVLARNKKGQNV